MLELDEKAQFQLEEAQRKANEAQIIAELEALPPTKFSIPYVHMMDSRLGALEKTIKSLNSFIRFLSKLNPMEYLRWMADAFAHYKASIKIETASTQEEAPTAIPSPTHVATQSVRPSKSGTKKKKGKVLTPN